MTIEARVFLIVGVIVIAPWVVIVGAVGYAALDSMLCWAHYGAGHMGIEGTRWLMEKCG